MVIKVNNAKLISQMYTFICCFTRLFTSIINGRLKKRDSENDFITGAQFCFKENFGLVGTILLHSLCSREYSVTFFLSLYGLKRKKNRLELVLGTLLSCTKHVSIFY